MYKLVDSLNYKVMCIASFININVAVLHFTVKNFQIFRTYSLLYTHSNRK